MLGAVVAGLGVGELVFRSRDDGAFPHLRCYVPDPELGLRLEPGRVEKIRFGGAPTTTVRINSEGLRGGELPAPTPDDVLVLGDSQAFGLGVEENETFAAVLAKKLGRTVVDAGVPTYGPLEYALQAERRLAARPARTVVVLLAFQNDFFEASRPNGTRHAAWDGWAVRKESAPDRVFSFPGRALLYRESHLFYALRRTLHTEAGAGVTRVASGGTVADFLPLSAQVDLDRENERAQRQALTREADPLLGATQRRGDADTLIGMLRPDELSSEQGYVKQRALVRASTAHPGDIVEEGLGEGEEALSITATAKMIAEGARLRDELARRWWEKNGKTVTESRELAIALHTKLAELRVASNPIAPALARIAARCKAAGARLVVAGLPTDTMVTPEAFAKYGEAPVDTAPIAHLADDLRLATEAAGATWVDLLPTLQPLGLAGWLPKEFHLSAQGHAKVAERLAAVVARVELPRPAEPAAVLGPFADFVCDGCSANVEPRAAVDASGVLRMVRMPLAGDVLPPTVALGWHELVVDLQPGEEVRGAGFQFTWRLSRAADGTYHLDSKPAVAEEYLGRLHDACEDEALMLANLATGRSSAGPLEPQFLLGRGCLSLPDAAPWKRPRRDGYLGEPLVLDGSPLPADHALACASGDPTFAPACRAGEVRVGPAAACRALCDDTHACETDFRCVPYRGARVCAPLLATNPTCFQWPKAP